MKEYKLANGWVVFNCIAGLLLMVFIIKYLWMPHLAAESSSTTALLFSILVTLLFAGIIIFVMLNSIYGRVYIGERKIQVKKILSKKELGFDEISGFKIERGNLIVLPKQANKSQLAISAHYGNIDELMAEVRNRFKDLNAEYFKQTENEILENMKWGRSNYKRIVNLQQAKRVTTILNTTGVFIFLWLLLIPKPYEAAFVTAMAMFVIITLALIYFQGLIIFEDEHKSAYPSLFLGGALISGALLIRGLLDYNILDFSKAWLISIPAGMAFSAIVASASRTNPIKTNKRFGQALLQVLIFCGFAFGACTIINCYYDSGESELVRSIIIDKHNSSTKNKDYNLQLQGEGQIYDVRVSRRLYEAKAIGDKVELNLKKGKFGMPWVVIRK